MNLRTQLQNYISSFDLSGVVRTRELFAGLQGVPVEQARVPRWMPEVIPARKLAEGLLIGGALVGPPFVLGAVWRLLRDKVSRVSTVHPSWITSASWPSSSDRETATRREDRRWSEVPY